MIYSNIKIESLKSIMEEKTPAVVVLVETKLAENEDLSIDGYESWPMNRDEHGGGVMVLIRKELKNIVLVMKNRKK